MVFDLRSGKPGYVMGIYPDDSSAIDFVLDDQTVKKIYAEWDEKTEGQLIDYGGGVKAITAHMLSEAGIDFLTRLKGVGKKRAETILETVRAVADEVPHG